MPLDLVKLVEIVSLTLLRVHLLSKWVSVFTFLNSFPSYVNLLAFHLQSRAQRQKFISNQSIGNSKTLRLEYLSTLLGMNIK